MLIFGDKHFLVLTVEGDRRGEGPLICIYDEEFSPIVLRVWTAKIRIFGPNPNYSFDPDSDDRHTAKTIIKKLVSNLN